MLERVHSFIGARTDQLGDIAKVAGPNALVLAFVKLIDLKTLAEIVLILITIAHAIWRWRRDAKKG